MMIDRINTVLLEIQRKIKILYKKYNKNRTEVDKILMILLYVMVFFMFYYIETKMDDNTYKNIFGTNIRLSNLKDVFISQKEHYLSWSGRAICHAILQIMFLAGRFWAAIFYAFIFVLLVYEISSYIDDKHTYILLIAGLLFFINPDFEESIRWRTGFCNYAMNMVFVLIASKPFVMYLKDDTYRVPKYYFLLLPIALFAGWSIENAAATMCMLMAFVLFYKFVIKNDKKDSLIYVLTFVFSCIGCALLVLAPGSMVRIETEEGAGLLNIAYRGYGQVMAWFNWLLPCVIIFVILFYINKRNKVKTNYLFTITMLIWFVMNNIVMIAATIYPQRAAFCPFVIMLVLIIDEINKIYNNDKSAQGFINVIGLLVYFSFIFTLLGIDILSCVRRNGVDIPG